MLNNKICKIGYIRKDNRKYENLREKCKKILRKVLLKVQFEQIRNGTIILVPESKKYNHFIKRRILKQINSYITKQEFNGFVFEEGLEFLKQNIDRSRMVNGKLLMKSLLIKILESIFYTSRHNMNLENIYIFVNCYSKENICIIEKLVEKFKTVNIITQNLRYYKRLEDSLYRRGILITVSNNKRKSARSAKYIVNIDFEKELFEKYCVNMNSVLINLTESENFFENNFKGVVVNDFKLRINPDRSVFVNEFFGNIDTKLYVESQMGFNVGNIDYVENMCREYGVEVFPEKKYHGMEYENITEWNTKISRNGMQKYHGIKYENITDYT